VPNVNPEGQQELQRANQDLAACLALPALWRGRDAHYIPSTLLVRLFALTGNGQPQDRRRSEVAGFDTHLVKPVDEAALLRALTC
jgi:hypothetical protein